MKLPTAKIAPTMRTYMKPKIGGEVCLRTDSDILAESTASSTTVETGGQDAVDIDLENGGFDATWEP